MGHTAGPWGIGRSRKQIFVLDSKFERAICQVGPMPKEQHEANAALIVAAPELLEACEAMDKANTPETIDAAYKLARAAIKKARGES